ncbi:MAG: flagellar biosynthetic protein FliQ [Phycisphaeraceae bacterium]|nr:flagellar biosynthetic protein FliQ [Phycisphaeraceae bacterium]MBX3362087.1 flagellar biosynthetic protein FliQ [Phycisphaeraceae bacterium]MBX3366785.1 flagellar biosynthetic protein FliQ [Phycisphaeraceae bacterium]MCW5767527.1 flagellar biosynthetic protein FliQ [Phycisphaeraceae bacterium]QYK46849.1 MAG: flagellar biosynthetic protein FliQ [Phycisphaeraceae bacterium]
MNDGVIEMTTQMLLVMLKIAAPILLVGMLVGLGISIFQSVTSIQDQTLTFVPKIAVMVIVAALLIPWIAQRLIEYAIEAFTLS